MATIFILGAGASCFADFPLGRSLLDFLVKHYEATREVNVREECKDFIDFAGETKPHIPEKWRYDDAQPDLEFLLALVDRVKQRDTFSDFMCSRILVDLLADLDTTIRQANLHNRNLSPVELGGRILVSSAFQDYSFRAQRRICEDLQCKKVARLWGSHIKQGDCIVTFNWDLLHEIILWSEAKWDYSNGYGVDLRYGTQACSPVLILKLHGSVNWPLRYRNDVLQWIDYVTPFFPSSRCNHVEDSSSTMLGSTADMGESLILPSYLKNPRIIPVLSEIWKKAEAVLGEATDVVVFGYSLPTGDFESCDMVLTALRRNQNLRSVKVVLGNDTKAFERWEDLCYRAGKIDVVQFVQETFEQFLAAES